MEHEPGLTELRLNVKASIAAANAFAKRLGSVERELQEVKDTLAQTLATVEAQTKTLNALNAKLYEKGIR